MSKVLIINSPLFRYKNSLYEEDSLPPLGLGYIATTLFQRDFDVELIDAVADNIPLSDLISVLREKSPSVIATNIFTTNYELVKDLIEGLSLANCKYIIGGLSTKTLYQEICTWNVSNAIDIVFGDGENIVPDLIAGEVKQEPLFSSGNKRVFQVDNASIYYSKDISFLKLDRTYFKNEPVFHPMGFIEANIITSRGCIYNCAFCAAASSLNREFSIRERSNESIIEELSLIKRLYPEVNSIRVLDDLFLKNAASIEKAIQVFTNSGLGWRSMAHVMTFKNVTQETLKALKNSGCNELFIGIESGSPVILKSIHKTNNIDLIKTNLVNLFKAGISVKGYFIYGFPNETEDDFRLTYQLAHYLKEQALALGSGFRTSVFQFRPYHGTELYHQIEQSGVNIRPVTSVEPDEKLSSLVGRLQFNFHSGNYSSANSDLVHKYIYDTMNLNDLSKIAPTQ